MAAIFSTLPLFPIIGDLGTDNGSKENVLMGAKIKNNSLFFFLKNFPSHFDFFLVPILIYLSFIFVIIAISTQSYILHY